MAAASCDRIRDDLSAYVDGTVTPRRWEQISYHLAGCQTCRDDVAAISSVCDKLSACRRSAAPDALTARLESIAGEQASAPLYMAAGEGDLPSARRQRGRRVAQSGAALLAVMMSVVVLAVLIAPEPLRLTDPVKTAREQFSMSSSAISVNEAVGAVLLASERGADLGQSIGYRQRSSDGLSTGVSAERAATLLRRAAEADLTLTGLQRVWVSDGAGRFRSAEVRTTKVRGEGAQLEVLDARGNRFSSSFLPEFGARPVEAPDDWTFSVAVGTERVGEREATHLRAERDGVPVAGWWLDTETGLMLWAERYDTTGAVTLAVGYKDLTFGVAEFDPSQITQHITLQPASTSGTDGWCIGLPRCPQEMAGLPLVAYASSDQEGRRAMNLVYSDGFETAVVGWTEGVLDGGDTKRTDRAAGAPTVELWQCGEAVVWVTSNASAKLIQEISSELPQEEPYQASLLDRAVAGFDRLNPVG